jgi:hypothetical protein
MSKHVHTHDYLAQYKAGAHGVEDFMEYYIAAFERDTAAALEGTESQDVGAVILYTRAGEEVAYFDYENLVGSVYAQGGTRADHVPS